MSDVILQKETEQEEAENREVQNNAALSFTELTKNMFAEDAIQPWHRPERRAVIDSGFDSIYDAAAADGIPVFDFIAKDPEMAVMFVEKSYSKWLNILSQGAIQGSIETTKGVINLTKNQTKALEMRLAQAKTELDFVTDYAMSITGNDGKKRNHLLRTLYMNAVMHRDTKALIYLIDRVDGRPGETKVESLSYDNAYNIYMIIHTLFDKQLNVLNAGNGTVLVCCSRRSGKSHMLVAGALIECLRKPNTTCIYIGETLELTEGIVDDAMNKIIDSCHLQDKKGNRFNWRKMDNRSKLLVRGLSNTKDPDQIRGKGAKVIIIDEFFHLKSELLQYLQDEVLQPMQMDYADDYKFICAGTPPQIRGTYGEMAWKNWDVPHFHWTWRQNPHPVSVEAREEFVNTEIAKKGLTWDMPSVRREYLGEWAYDDELVLYPDYKTFNKKEAFPAWKISRIFIGVDYGVSDNDCLFALAWSDDEGRGYELFETKFNRLDIKDKSITQLEYLKEKVKECWILSLNLLMTAPESTYNAESLKQLNKNILWSADDNDQHITDELAVNVNLSDYGEKYEKLSLQIENAHKTEKKMMWDKTNELFRTGRLLIQEGGDAEHECVSTILLRGPNGEVYSEIDDRAYHPDLIVAMRYALWNVLGNR